MNDWEDKTKNMIENDMKKDSENNKILRYSKHRFFFRFAIFVIFISTVFFVYNGINKKKKTENHSKNVYFKNTSEFKSEGGNMTYYGYNKKNEKTIKITCTKSEVTKDNKILMNNITATFIPKSRVKNKIIISGDKGIVGNNFYDFIINGNAKIISKDFSMNGTSLELKNKDLLTSDNSIEYRAKMLNGKADSMIIHFNQSLLSFYGTHGSYKIKDKIVRYKSARLHINDKLHIMSLKKLKKENLVWGDDFSITGERILTQFSDDFKVRIYTHVRHDCLFLMKKKKENIVDETRSIKAKYINMEYDDSGDIASVFAKDHTEVKLINDRSEINILTNAFNMVFYEKTQSVKSLSFKSNSNKFIYKNTESEGNIGKDFVLEGYEINVLYSEDGEISECEALDKKQTKFISNKYLCEGNTIKHHVSKSRVVIKGNAMVKLEDNNIFNSEELIIDTEKKILQSSKPVSAKIILKKKSVLLSAEPIYVNSQSMRLDESKSIMKFKGKVSLIQDDVLIKTDVLIISEKSGIKCKKKSDIKTIIVFFNNKKKIILKGDIIDINKNDKLIKINGNAVLKDDLSKLKGDNLFIYFNNDGIVKITGSGNIKFKKDKLVIESENVRWLYDKELAFFEKLKKIEKKKTGRIIGKKIKLNLRTNLMTVFSDNDERTKTVLE